MGALPQWVHPDLPTHKQRRTSGLTLSPQLAGLSRSANAADYVIIAPDSLAEAAGLLAAYRQQKGLRPVVVLWDHTLYKLDYYPKQVGDWAAAGLPKILCNASSNEG